VTDASTGDLTAIWIYLLAPVAGAAVGALAYQTVRGSARAPA
jgi:glycerol uptake facilitator-like aquaporin